LPVWFGERAVAMSDLLSQAYIRQSAQTIPRTHIIFYTVEYKHMISLSLFILCTCSLDLPKQAVDKKREPHYLHGTYAPIVDTSPRGYL